MMDCAARLLFSVEFNLILNTPCGDVEPSETSVRHLGLSLFSSPVLLHVQQ